MINGNIETARENSAKSLLSLSTRIGFTKPEPDEDIFDYEKRQLSFIAETLGALDYDIIDSYERINNLTGNVDSKTPVVIPNLNDSGSYYLIVPYFKDQDQQIERFAMFRINYSEFDELELSLIQLAVNGISGNLFSYQAIEDFFASKKAEFAHNLREVTTHLAHFIATPLSEVKMSNHIIGRKLSLMTSPTVEKDQVNELLEAIQERRINIDHGADFISRVTASANDYLRLISGGIEQQPREQSATDVALTIEQLIKSRYKTHFSEGEIIFEIDSNLNPQQKLNVDSGLLQEALEHIINNSLDFSKRDEKPNVKIKVSNVDGKLTIEVIDEGVGIEEKNISRLFEPFFQEDKSGTRFKNGTGFGVGIKSAKMLLDLIGAGIDVRSTKGVGTTVTITLN